MVSLLGLILETLFSGYIACFIDHDYYHLVLIVFLICFAVARGRKRKQDSVDNVVSPMVDFPSFSLLYSMFFFFI